MMLLLLELLFAPICATTAAMVVWLLHRDEELGDGELLRNFVVVLIMSGVALWGTSRTNAVRLRLDPQYRMQTQIEANAVYDALRRSRPDDARSLRELLVTEMLRGEELSAALLQARPMLTASTNDMLGFADQQSRRVWARVTVDSLKELQAMDPELCYQALAGRSLGSHVLQQVYSAENTRAFHQAVIGIYESGALGMTHERPPGEKPADFNEAALEFRAVQDAIEQHFGPVVAKEIARRTFSEVLGAPAEQICAARIFQLEAMLQRPKPVAAMLIDSVLR